MKFFLYSDQHFCKTSSLIQSKGKTYTTRLEYEIRGLNWAEEEAVKNSCDAMICLGDFFDKPNLEAEELTALKEIKWNNLPKYFVIGNHEAAEHSIYFNSTQALQGLGFKIIDKPYNTNIENCDLTFIPYIIESDRKPLVDYLEPSKTGRRIIFSHNDIKGLQYGKFTSIDGFDVDEIDNNCDLFLNGHLHNGERFSKKGINLGNFCGQNFTEDAFNHKHCAFILDTDTLELKEIENPYAFNFYKFDINFEEDIHILDKIKNNAIISIKCLDSLQDNLKEALEYHKDKIIEKRVSYFKETTLTTDEIAQSVKDLNNKDYLQQLVDFTVNKLGSDEIVISELQKIMQ